MDAGLAFGQAAINRHGLWSGLVARLLTLLSLWWRPGCRDRLVQRDMTQFKTGSIWGLMGCLLLVAVVDATPPQAGPKSPESKKVVFAGHQLKLAGTLLIPGSQPGGKKLPGVVIVGETGTTTRDGIRVGTVEHDVYRQLAESLAEQGIASLRYDRRCQGESECRKIETYDDYIDDLHGAVTYLAAHPAVDSKRIVLLGHGEGAFLATSLLAQIDDVAAGLVVAAMSGRNLGKFLRDKFQAQMSEEGRSPAEIKSASLKVERVTRPIFYNQLDLVKEKFDPQDPYDAELMGLLAEPQRAVSLMVNDPLQVLASVRVPVLILQGAKDLEMTTKDAAFLDEALKRIYHPDHTLRVYPNMDHLLRANPGRAGFGTYRDTSLVVDQQFLRQTGEWITEKFGAVNRSSGRQTAK